MAGRADELLAVEPKHGGPVVAVGRVHFAQRRGHQLDVGMLLDDAVDHHEKRVGIELRLARDIGAGDAEAFLQVFFVADQRIDVADDPSEHLLARAAPPTDAQSFGAIVQVERGDGAGGLGGLHAFDDQFRGRFRQRGEDAAGMKPADAAAEDVRPSRNRPA